MKPLTFFFWFFLITINLMAKEPIISKYDKSPIIIGSVYNYFILELQMNAVACDMPLSSSQISRITNKHSHVVLHTPHLYIRGYLTGKCTVFSYIVIDKYIASTHWNNNNSDFYFLEEILFYGKAPPDEIDNEVKIFCLLLERDKASSTSISII